MTKPQKVSLFVLCCLSLMQSAFSAGQVMVYPAAPLPRAAEFAVQVNGQDIPVLNAGTFRCAPFAFSGTVEVAVTYRRGPITSFQINPLSKGITARQQGQTLLFTLTQPQNLEVQINGATSQVVDGDKLLYLFADAPERNAPQPGDKDVLYFGPGAHSPTGGVVRVGDDDPHTALYVAPGALLNAALIIKRSKPFKISGRGFIQNPFITKPPKGKGQFAVRLDGCTGLVMEDVIFFNSIWHGIKFFGGRDNLVRNVKALHYIVNSDGISLHGTATRNVVEHCFIVGNDNLIVIGGAKEKQCMSSNLIHGCTFIKSSYAGNWGFPQGDGPIGPGNVVDDCDVIRCNGQVGLIRMFWAKPTTVENIVFQNIRVQSLAGYQPNPQKSNLNRFLSLESDGPEFARSFTFKNIYLPSAQTSFIAPGKWFITFDHVFVAGQPATCDADLNLTKGPGVVTKYIH